MAHLAQADHYLHLHQFVLVCLSSPFFVLVRLYSPLFTFIHLCSPLFTFVHLCSALFTFVRICSSLFVLVQPGHHAISDSDGFGKLALLRFILPDKVPELIVTDCRAPPVLKITVGLP